MGARGLNNISFFDDLLYIIRKAVSLSNIFVNKKLLGSKKLLDTWWYSCGNKVLWQGVYLSERCF